MNDQIIEEFRANEGRVGGMFEGVPLVLLTTIGARTGERRTTPVTYRRDGARLVVFASNRGADRHPAWYHNLRSNPAVTVETGTQTYAATAISLGRAERDAIYQAQAAEVPAFAEYQRATSRIIPAVALYRTPAGSEAARATAISAFLRKVHDDLRTQFAALRDAPAQTLDRDLRVHCLTFCEALGGHHTNESGPFDTLQEHYPGLAPVLERLRREHTEIARILDELQAALAGSDPAKIRAGVDALATDLEAHFAYEEENLIPALNALNPDIWAARAAR